MKQITFWLVAVATVAVAVAFTARASRHTVQDAAPIFVTQIPAGYRDWRLISVAHEEGDLNDIRAILVNDERSRPIAQESFHSRRDDHRANSLASRPVGGKQQSLWPRPVFHCWGRTALVPAVYGQGLKKIRRDRRLGVRAI
ncbi:MAG TPA: hypothetical protein VJ023_08845 [Pyrinomonadaceae bacterium]|nr:hypothetical protein [Pyrinomonadaceae bacterium]